ncbi:SRP40, C-terminal domain-containing protein [Cryptosporidium felis]|nr:SRP40, C-terminal domain-containing protein [Cryptosporidium felis]
MEDINRVEILWLVKDYLDRLGVNKAVKYIEKSCPALNNLKKKDQKRLKKLPNLEDLLQNIKLPQIDNPKKEEYGTLEASPNNETINEESDISKVNINKKSKSVKKRKLFETVNSESSEISGNNEKQSQENTPQNNDSPNNNSCSSICNRFKRIDEEKYKNRLSDNRLNDNSYWNMKKYSKNADDFASKAAFELGQVRGKGFRQEKAKKKRCSWKGNGPISTGVSSIQFSDSD